MFTVKLGVACGATINVLLIVSVHPLAVVIVKITLYVPADVYVWLGLFDVDVPLVSPKSQLYVIGEPGAAIVLPLVNVTELLLKHCFGVVTVKLLDT